MMRWQSTLTTKAIMAIFLRAFPNGRAIRYIFFACSGQKGCRCTIPNALPKQPADKQSKINFHCCIIGGNSKKRLNIVNDLRFSI